MEKEKNCINCKRIFVTNNYHPEQEYCSNFCWKVVNSKDSNRKHYKKNKENILEYHKEYNQRPEVIVRKKQYAKDYKQENIEKIRENFRRWVEQNREKKKQVQKVYYLNNKERFIELSKESHKKRYKSDTAYRLVYILRRRLQSALKYFTINGKVMGSSKYGIDYKAIIEHLKPFPEDLSKYHVDHIRPLCTFNLIDPDEVKKAFAPENHQWLLAKDNLSKGGRWDGN